MSSSCVQESPRGGLWSPPSTRKEMEGRVWPAGSRGPKSLPCLGAQEACSCVAGRRSRALGLPGLRSVFLPRSPRTGCPQEQLRPPRLPASRAGPSLSLSRCLSAPRPGLPLSLIAV